IKREQTSPHIPPHAEYSPRGEEEVGPELWVAVAWPARETETGSFQRERVPRVLHSRVACACGSPRPTTGSVGTAHQATSLRKPPTGPSARQRRRAPLHVPITPIPNLTTKRGLPPSPPTPPRPEHPPHPLEGEREAAAVGSALATSM